MTAGTAHRRALGLVLEIRLLPVVMWSFTALTLGTAVGADAGGQLHPGRFIVAVVIGVLVQGLVAHCVNDLADWRSGTDRHPSPRNITGGSKVLPLGLMSERDLRVTGWIAGGLAAALGLLLAGLYGWELLWLGAVGLAGAVAYTLAPARAAYRPVLGELIAFACMAACVLGGARLQAGHVPDDAYAVAVCHSAACVAMLLVHHLPDRAADLAAHPVKRTTPTLLGTRHPVYAVTWALLATGAGALLAIDRDPAFWPLAAGAACTAVAALVTARDTPRAVLLAEIVMIVAVSLGGALSATLLVPALTPALFALPAAALVEGAAAHLARGGARGAPDRART